MANSRQTEQKRESLWTLAAAVGSMLGVFGVAIAFGSSSVQPANSDRASVVHDPAFQAMVANYDYEMSRPRAELFGDFADGDIHVGNCFGYLAATMRADRRRYFSELPGGQDYAECLPLRTVGLSPGPEYHLAPASSLGKALADRLDPSSLKGTLPDWVTGSRRLGDVKIEEISVSSHAVTMRHHGQRLVLEILASSDVVRSRLEDLVVRVSGAGPVRYIVLTQSPDGSLNPIAEHALMVLTNSSAMPMD